RVIGRVIVFPSLEARRHWQSRDVDIVLNNYRDAMQRPNGPAGGFHRGIQPVSFFERVWVDGDQGINEWAAFVVPRNPIKVRLHDRMNSGTAGEVGSFETGYGSFFDGKGYFLSGENS